MTDGSFSPSGGSAGAADATSIAESRFVDDGWGSVAIGQLGGDDAPEAAVVLACQTGEATRSTTAVVYGSGPSIVGTVPVDGAAAVRVADGTLDVVGLTPSSVEAACCPSVVEGHRFRLEGDDLVEVERDVLSATDPVSPGRWGPVQLGHTYADAAMALPVPLDVDDPIEDDPVDFDPATDRCLSGSTTGDPQLDFIGSSDRIGVVFFYESGPRTSEGVGIGSTAAEVRDAYSGDVTEGDNPYSGIPDLYVGVRPGDRQGAGIRFGVDANGTVTGMDVGVQPYLGYAEGCA